MIMPMTGHLTNVSRGLRQENCGLDILAPCDTHTIIPARQRRRNVVDLSLRIIYDVPPRQICSNAPGNTLANCIPKAASKAPGHGDVDGRHDVDNE